MRTLVKSVSFAVAFVVCASFIIGTIYAQSAGQLSELENLKLQNVNLQSQLARVIAEKSDCQAALGPLQARQHSESINSQVAALKVEVENAHPGFTFDPSTGKLTPIPNPPKPETKKE